MEYRYVGSKYMHFMTANSGAPWSRRLAGEW
jgi:hypothetical protein